MFRKLQKSYFLILASLIVVLALFLRFYDYDNRWGLAYDQAYGALVARYALDTFQLPLLGPFSSAGPFQTGGEWYWFIMLGTLLSPSSVISPWILLSISSVVFVILLIFLGKELINQQFGLIVGLLAAVSTSEIAQSFNLTNQSIISLISLLAIWASIRYIRWKQTKYLFFLGFLTSLAVTIHLQGVALIFLVITTLIFTGIPNIREIGALILGFIIPAIPMLIFGTKSGFVNSKNMIQYFLYDQYKVSFEVLNRRWLTYIGYFWPESLAHILGGEKIISLVIAFGVGAISIFSFIKKKISTEWLVLIVAFFTMVFI